MVTFSRYLSGAHKTRSIPGPRNGARYGKQESQAERAACQSQPRSSAIRTASERLRVPVLAIALDR
jgi:hypothetical protein